MMPENVVVQANQEHLSTLPSHVCFVPVCPSSTDCLAEEQRTSRDEPSAMMTTTGEVQGSRLQFADCRGVVYYDKDRYCLIELDFVLCSALFTAGSWLRRSSARREEAELYESESRYRMHLSGPSSQLR